MIKKLLLLSAIASVTACTSYNEYKSCDPEKNYIISDPVAMEEYKKLRESGEVQSYYTETNPIKPCFNVLCVNYNPEKFSFMEKRFSDEERKGVYTITKTKDLTDKTCINKSPVSLSIDYCFKVEKNNNNEIKSRYKFLLDFSNKDVTIIKFIDLKNNKNLYEYSYQTYLTGAIGGPGGGMCATKKINNPDFKFNPIFFPEYNK